MKNVMKWVLIACFAIGGSTAVLGQQLKLGYINANELFSIMPEQAAARAKLDTLGAELQDQLELLQVEYNTKVQDYVKVATTLSDSARALKDKELQDINQRIQESQQMAQEEFTAMQNSLFTPVVEKMQATIDKVAQDNGMTAVFDLSVGSLIYQDTTTMIDMLPLVKAELGIE
ncbi:MAG: OmpH family outer membrane protein [Rikenellaceae bacterium]|jgi:outer membrane protein|nr:OmpH family outer membrane protein [Rikenellaceae bacterium]